ncbi:MAG TPA: efflux RND transporter permease subunit [Burkholderiaceae bacterium]|nr:efflux RND transporter permease subunit [Burkholderiaceae bacterium]
MNASSWSLPMAVLLAPLGLTGVLPGVDLQTIQVTATLKGAVPSRLELDVGHKIEDRLASLDRLDHIATLITDGSVAINASFAHDKNGAQALSEVRDAVDSVCADVPPGAPKTSSAFLSYRIQSVTPGSVTPRNAIWPGIVRGNCQLATRERA